MFKHCATLIWGSQIQSDLTLFLISNLREKNAFGFTSLSCSEPLFALHKWFIYLVTIRRIYKSILGFFESHESYEK